MAQIPVELIGAERDADEYIELEPGRDLFLVDAREQIRNEKRFDGFPSCFIFVKSEDDRVVSEVNEHRIRVVDCRTEGILVLKIDFKKLQDSAAAEKERLEELKSGNRSEAVVNAANVASSVLDHVTKIGDALAKIGENFLTEETAVAVQRAAGVMACAPFVGTAFAVLIPVLESINESNQVASKIAGLFERLDRLLSYLDEVLKYVQAKGGTDTEGDKTFCIVMTLVDQCITEICSVNKKRHSKVLRRVKRLWRSTGHLKNIEELDNKITTMIIERTLIESMKSAHGISQLNDQFKDWTQKESNSRGQCIPSSSQPPPSNLPQAIKLIGREYELTSLANKLQSNGTMASLSGGGGMGKSQIAITFARGWYEDDKDARFVWLIESETEGALRKDYLEILAVLGEPAPIEEEGNIPTSEIAANVLKRLSTLSFDWLLVFDNVPETNDGPEGFKQLFFPTTLQGFARGRVLFTSRSVLFAGHTCLGNFDKVRVGALPESAAVKMLLSNVEYEDSDEETERAAALRFARQLGCLPLALATVSGYVLSRGITVKEYLDEFESYDVTEAVSKALEDALSYARGQGMGDILDIAAFVNPDSIPLELLGGDDVRAKARHLCGMSILRRVRRDVYSVHRLHQEVLREGRSSAMAVDALNGILDSFDVNRSETWQVGRDMYLHIEALEKHAKCTTDQKKLRLSRLLEEGGNFLCKVLNDFNGAEAKLSKALAMKRHVYGDDAKNLDLAGTLNDIGLVYDERGEYDKALALHEEALAMKRHVYGDGAKNADVASTLNNIANLHRMRGEYDKALALYEEALAMERHVYGDDAKNADVACKLNNIGVIHRTRGEYDKALALHEEALAMKRHVYGDGAKNANVASTLNNIANLHYNRGEYDKALAMYQEALAMKRHVYGDDAKNTDLAHTLNNIAGVHYSRGEYDKALAMNEEALSMKRHVYGNDAKNADLAGTLNNIGVMHESRAEYDKALAMFEEALAMKRHVYGDDAMNADLASTLNNIGEVHYKWGEYDKALTMYEEALVMERHVCGDDSKNAELATILHNIGLVCGNQGEYGKALAMFEEALAMDRHVYGDDTKNTLLATILNDLAIVHDNLGERDKALRLFEKTLAMNRHVFIGDAKNVS